MRFELFLLLQKFGFLSVDALLAPSFGCFHEVENALVEVALDSELVEFIGIVILFMVGVMRVLFGILHELIIELHHGAGLRESIVLLNKFQFRCSLLDRCHFLFLVCR